MLGLDRNTVNHLLSKLEELEFPFPEFKYYKINDQPRILGKGGFSVVYEMTGKDTADKHYAMKVIGMERHVVSSDVFWNTFRIQRILCDYSPYIMRILVARELLVSLDEEGSIKEVQDADGERWTEDGWVLQFVLMEKLEDVLVKDKFRNTTLVRDELRNEKEVLTFAMQIGQAIMLAHDNNVLHRDIKLENIFWDRSAECYKLGDFGIAKYVEGGNAETVVYTDGYGAPEIERRLNDNYNATADIYSFGITLYLLLNELKFPGSEGYYVNMVQYDPSFIFPAPKNASEPITRVIRKMCSYRKEDRYQTMTEVLADLNRVSELQERMENEDNVELADLVTETYREEKENYITETYLEDDEEYDDVKEDSEVQSRASRKKQEQAFNQYYKEASAWYLVGFSLLFALLIKGLQSDTAFAISWQFWTFPIAVLVEGILLRMKEFHIVFGIVTILLGVYSIFVVGLTVPHILLMLCVLISIPSITVAGAIGTGIWMLLVFTGKLGWLEVISNYDLSWIILAIILIMMYRILNLRIALDKTTYLRALGGTIIYDILALAMIIIGVVLLILQHYEVLVIPEVITHLHLIRTGIAVFAAYMFFEWWE